MYGVGCPLNYTAVYHRHKQFCGVHCEKGFHTGEAASVETMRGSDVRGCTWVCNQPVHVFSPGTPCAQRFDRAHIDWCPRHQETGVTRKEGPQFFHVSWLEGAITLSARSAVVPNEKVVISFE